MPAFADLMKVRGEVAAGTTLFGYTYGGGKYSEEQAKRELQSYNDSIKARQMTEQEMSRQKVVEKFKGLLDQVKQQGGVPTYDQKFWIANYRNQFKELALSISRVGLTPEEAKKIGPQVYNVVPLFANLQDIQSRGKDVAKELGLSGEGEVKFINAQIDIYKRNSKEAMIDSPARGLFRGED